MKPGNHVKFEINTAGTGRWRGEVGMSMRGELYVETLDRFLFYTKGPLIQMALKRMLQGRTNETR